MTIEEAITRQLDSYHLLLELITRLHTLSSSKEVRQELADLIQRRIKEYDTATESLEIQIENHVSQTDPNRKRYLVSLDRIRENLRLAKVRFRKAQIQSKKNTELAWIKERELIFRPPREDDKSKSSTNGHSKDSGGSGKRELSTQDMLVSKSEDITAKLRHVHQMAQTEVVKSSLNIDELDYSTKTLRELEHKYSAFDVMLNGSQRLVRHLEEADKWDRIYMLASLGFLALVVAWILWRRIFKAPTMLVLWVMLKFFRLVRPSPSDIVNAKSSIFTAPVAETQEIAASAVSSSSELASASGTVLDSISSVTETADELIETLASVLSEAVSTAAETLLAATNRAEPLPVHNDL
ncbi:Sec20p [Sugiyamaella lignohabitans]|uniref:Sec20p n=1 Tax=Sugiyamaella lignohabitans TaxID=796027 RepID=A0A161HJ97_9ASCO|nr:Sec20p [Sugiyamaella lignohabitans]ANB11438.1 Sec20p [Sugiyamaella lignohabitans]